MRGTGNHHIRLVGTKLYVVVRNRDHDIKIFAGSNIAEARQTRDDVLRELGMMKPEQTEYVPLTKKERAAREAARPVDEPKRLPRRREDYYTTGCVLLCAAVHMTPEAYEWAMDTLDTARAIDGRRS